MVIGLKLCPLRIVYSLYFKQKTRGNNATIFSIRYGKIYLKTAKNYLEKGSDYAKKEIQRLERILEKVIFYLQVCKLL